MIKGERTTQAEEADHLFSYVWATLDEYADPRYHDPRYHNPGGDFTAKVIESMGLSGVTTTAGFDDQEFAELITLHANKVLAEELDRSQDHPADA